MTKGNQWAMKFEAVAGQLTNAQYANLGKFFDAVIEEEREACLEIVDAWIRPGASTLDRTVGGVVALKIARKIRARGNKD
jgi:hypothetical protein